MELEQEEFRFEKRSSSFLLFFGDQLCLVHHKVYINADSTTLFLLLFLEFRTVNEEAIEIVDIPFT
jgi:hypothetical protein